jgi:hypothetical protein
LCATILSPPGIAVVIAISVAIAIVAVVTPIVVTAIPVVVGAIPGEEVATHN